MQFAQKFVLTITFKSYSWFFLLWFIDQNPPSKNKPHQSTSYLNLLQVFKIHQIICWMLRCRVSQIRNMKNSKKQPTRCQPTHPHTVHLRSSHMMSHRTGNTGQYSEALCTHIHHRHTDHGQSMALLNSLCKHSGKFKNYYQNELSSSRLQ